MQALVWQGANKVEAAAVPEPSAPPGWVLVEPAYTGLCGTDLHICHGEHPRAQPGLVLGHEIAGRLLEPAGALPTGTAVVVNPLLACGSCRSCLQGQPHVCESLRLLGIDADGGAAEVLACPAGQLVPLPPGVDLRCGALVEPLAVAVRAVRRSGLRLGQRAHVIGAGPVGLLIAQCAKLAGATEVTVSELVPERAAVAAGFGFPLADPAAPDRRAEVVFDCTGHPDAAPAVTGWAATSGTVVTVGTYPGVAGTDLQNVVFRELTIIGTRVYAHADMLAAAELAARDPFGLSQFITSTVPIANGPEAVARLSEGSEVKVLVEGPAAG